MFAESNLHTVIINQNLCHKFAVFIIFDFSVHEYFYLQYNLKVHVAVEYLQSYLFFLSMIDLILLYFLNYMMLFTISNFEDLK